MMLEKYSKERGYGDNFEWTGTPTALYGEFKNIVDSESWNLNIDTKSRYYPKAVNTFTRRLNEVIPSLKEKGLKITYYKEGEETGQRR